MELPIVQHQLVRHPRQDQMIWLLARPYTQVNASFVTGYASAYALSNNKNGDGGCGR